MSSLSLSDHLPFFSWVTGLAALIGAPLIRVLWVHQTKLTSHDTAITDMNQKCEDHHRLIEKRDVAVTKALAEIGTKVEDYGREISLNTGILQTVLKEVQRDK